MVRTKLSKQEMITLNALIVLDVHAKDVVEMLWNSDANKLESFEWVK